MELGPEDVSLLESSQRMLPSRQLCGFLPQLQIQPTSHLCRERLQGHPCQSTAPMPLSARAPRQPVAECTNPHPMHQYQHH